jgi:hypothetical protein
MILAQIDSKIKKTNEREILWFVVIGVCSLTGGVFSAIQDPASWNFTKITHWAVRGAITNRPVYYFIIHVGAIALLDAVTSYVAGSIIVNILKSVKYKKLRRHRLRRWHMPFMPECYCCRKNKSFWTAYPSKICSEKICSQCLAELEFDRLFSIDERCEAYSGSGKFSCADDVIDELRKRKSYNQISNKERQFIEGTGQATEMPDANPLYPNKRKGLAIVLWLLGFGFLNIHNFYLSRIKIGLLRLVVFIAVEVASRSMSDISAPSPRLLILTSPIIVALLVWNIVDLIKIIGTPKRAFGKSRSRRN